MLVTSSGYEKQANYSWYGTEEEISHLFPRIICSLVSVDHTTDLDGVLHSDFRCLAALHLLYNYLEINVSVHMSLEIICLVQSLARAHICRQTSFWSCHWVEGVGGRTKTSVIQTVFQPRAADSPEAPQLAHHVLAALDGTAHKHGLCGRASA
jgi:hypothetical protein